MTLTPIQRAIGAFLGRFDKARELDKYESRSVWESATNTKYVDLIMQLIKFGYIEELSPEQKLATLKVSEIKEILKSNGLKVSGKKEDLVNRVIQEKPSLIEEAVKKVPKLYIATSPGNDLASSYCQEMITLKNEYREKVKGLISRGLIKQACLEVNAYECLVPLPFRRGIGIDWEDRGISELVPQAELVMKIGPNTWIADELPKSILKTILVATVESIYWGDPIEISRSVSIPDVKILKREVLDYLLLFDHMDRNAELLKRFRDNGLQCKIKVLSAGDRSCLFCQKMSEKSYTINTVPFLPKKECTHPSGCRCMYMVSER